MHQKLKPLFVEKKLKKEKLNLFTPMDFKRLFSVSDYSAQWFIKTYLKRGLFVKLRNGLYALADNQPDQYIIANRLYSPSYISFDTALSFHGIIPETVYSITSATTKTTRKFSINNINFVYHKIKKPAFVGYKPVKYMGEIILIAEAEKALADYLYFVSLKKRDFHYERINLKKIKKAKLLSCAALFKKPSMNKLIKNIYAEFRNPKRIY